MRFIIMVKNDAGSEAGVLPEPGELAEMERFNDEMRAAGVMLAAEGLHGSSQGARIRFSSGKFTVTDGPFAEAKELVGGFWLVQTKTKAEMLDWVKRVPFKNGEVEVRRLYEMEDFPPEPGPAKQWLEKEEAFREAAPAQTSRGNKKMRFMSFLLGDKQTESGVMPKADALAKMGAFIEEAVKAGVFLGGEGLKPTSESVRVVYDGTKRTITDGPFAEAKEIIAGYSILAVDSKEEAVEWTKRFAKVDAEIRDIPTVECEIRKLVEAEDFPQ